MRSQTIKHVPLNIAGSTKFGRYPKISNEVTYNMIISDGWLVPYAGYRKVEPVLNGGVGRGIFSSVPLQKLIVIIDDLVYTVDKSGIYNKVGVLGTLNGDVSIDENDAKQIAICDGSALYIYDYGAGTFTKPVLDFVPGYIAFQDGYFIAPVKNEPKWRLSDVNDGTSWPAAPQNVGLFQTKPDTVQACVRLPGRGNNLFVMGSTVTEVWTDVGYKLFPYQRSSSFNIDYGCLNSATIATGDTFVIWLGVNEKSGPTIIYSDGSDYKQISTDGINYRFSHLISPKSCYGFLFKQDGHLVYQITFYDPRDNFSLAYDFNTQSFFSPCSTTMGYHPVKKIAYANGTYYFVSIDDGNLYEMNSLITTFDGEEIPRVRVCAPMRMDDSLPFVVNSLGFTLEQGESNDKPRIDLSVSIDGGVTFGNSFAIELNDIANRRNRLVVWNLGYTNDFVAQMRFWGFGRFVIANGYVDIYQ